MNLADILYQEGAIEDAFYFTNHAVELMHDIVMKKDMPARAIVNVGADYQIGRLSLGFNVHNLFNTRYDRSGMNTNLIPQRGRWWMATIGYKL